MIIVYVFAVIATLFAGWRAWRRLRFFLHLFQLEGYKPSEYAGWLRAHPWHIFRFSHGLAVVVMALAAAGFFVLEAPFWTALLVLPSWAITFASSRLYRSERQKKPLAYTNRLKRLLGTAAGLVPSYFLVTFRFSPPAFASCSRCPHHVSYTKHQAVLDVTGSGLKAF